MTEVLHDLLLMAIWVWGFTFIVIAPPLLFGWILSKVVKIR